jgi:methylated-DNA-protein-cysteine methyltransferase related protein
MHSLARPLLSLTQKPQRKTDFSPFKKSRRRSRHHYLLSKISYPQNPMTKPIIARDVPPFMEKVWAITRQIPEGRVSSYGAIAGYLGLGSSRMVGWALKHSSMEPDVPAHRVVNRLGELSGRAHFGGDMMAQLLMHEGVAVADDKVTDFKELFWNPSLHLQ